MVEYGVGQRLTRLITLGVVARLALERLPRLWALALYLAPCN